MQVPYSKHSILYPLQPGLDACSVNREMTRLRQHSQTQPLTAGALNLNTFLSQTEHAFNPHDYGDCASQLGSWAIGHVTQADRAEPGVGRIE